MSLLPSVLASTMVMLLASASAQLVRDNALSQAQWEQQQKALSRAELMLTQSAIDLVSFTEEQSGSKSSSTQEVLVEQLAVSQFAELSDLPLKVFRISAVGRASQLSARLQADYAMVACDEDKDESEGGNDDGNGDGDKNGHQAITCTPKIRRIAWLRLGE
jgi:hypothetical protein